MVNRSTSARTNEFKAIAEPAWEKASRGIMRSLRRVYNEHMRAEGEARIPKNCVFNLIDGPDEWAEPPEVRQAPCRCLFRPCVPMRARRGACYSGGCRSRGFLARWKSKRAPRYARPAAMQSLFPVRVRFAAQDAMETAWRRARAKFGFTVAEEARAELLLAAAKAGGYFPSWDLSTQQSPVRQLFLVRRSCFSRR